MVGEFFGLLAVLPAVGLMWVARAGSSAVIFAPWSDRVADPRVRETEEEVQEDEDLDDDEEWLDDDDEEDEDEEEDE